jgi:hypothetical protein
MKMKKIAYLLGLSLLIACSNKSSENIPANILSKEDMAEILVDVHLLEASINLNVIPTLTTNVNEQTPVDIFKKNNITKKQYEESLNYYTEHPQVLAEVYDLVLISLSKMQAKSMNKN